MPEPLNWYILIRPTADGYSIKESSDDHDSELACSQAALAITEALSALIDTE